MLRISVSARSSGGAMVAVEGKVIGPWVEELRGTCERCLHGNAPVTIDLATVAFVSHEGAELLRRLRQRGALLVNASAFVTEQLDAWERLMVDRSPGNGTRG
jgi:hypothetical protein